MPDMASTRYVTYDIPSFKAEMKQLCPGCNIIADDANGDANLQRQQATSAISQGAKAIVVDPVDAGAAAGWVNQALSQGIKVIAYDRPFSALKVDYYVSFDNEVVGQMIAAAEISHLKATGALSAPGSGILIVNGSPTDAAAGLIKKGVHDVVNPSGVKVLAEYDTPDWTPSLAQAWVSSQITRFGSKIKGIIAANDGTGTAAVAALEGANVSPFPPVTGNDATLAGTQLVLTGKMLVTISKPGKTEADAAAHAVVALLQGKTVPLQAGGKETTLFGTPSQLFTPTLITPRDVQADLVATGFLQASQICTSTYAADCQRYGVKQ
jgi:D-xylose transport system substrate-binding protein